MAVIGIIDNKSGTTSVSLDMTKAEYVAIMVACYADATHATSTMSVTVDGNAAELVYSEGDYGLGADQRRIEYWQYKVTSQMTGNKTVAVSGGGGAGQILGALSLSNVDMGQPTSEYQSSESNGGSFPLTHSDIDELGMVMTGQVLMSPTITPPSGYTAITTNAIYYKNTVDVDEANTFTTTTSTNYVKRLSVAINSVPTFGAMYY